MANKESMAQRRTTSSSAPAGVVRATGRSPASKKRGRAGARTVPSRGTRARRVVYLVLVMALVAVAVAVNRGPAVDLLHARAAWTEQSQALAAAKEDVEAARAETEYLAAPSRLEVKARKDLGYVRPGEEMFIVEGDGNDGPTTTATTTAHRVDDEGLDPDRAKGVLERLVDRIRGAFE